MVTPVSIENRLVTLSKEVDEAHNDLLEVESHYFSMKAHYEIALAKSRLHFASTSSPTGKNYTVQQIESLALVENETLHLKMSSAEALVKGTRANASRIRTQVDIARSIGTSVRASLDL